MLKKIQQESLNGRFQFYYSVDPLISPFICELPEGKNVVFRDSRIVIDPHLLLQATSTRSDIFALVITIVEILDKGRKLRWRQECL